MSHFQGLADISILVRNKEQKHLILAPAIFYPCCIPMQHVCPQNTRQALLTTSWRST